MSSGWVGGLHAVRDGEGNEEGPKQGGLCVRETFQLSLELWQLKEN